MAEDAGAGETAKRKSKTKLIVLAAVAVIVLVGGGLGGGFALGLIGGGTTPAADAAPDDDGNDATAHAASESDHAAGADKGRAAPAGEPVFVDLPPLLVNLVVDEGRSRFLKLSLAVEVDDQKTADRITQLAPRIVDSFQLYLRTLTPDELQGPGSMFRLKEDLHIRIHEAIEPDRVRNVLFKEMLVQ